MLSFNNQKSYFFIGTGSGSPTKLGLPDNSGLIVGVNTINYDASSSVRNKAKVNKWIKIDGVFFAKFGTFFSLKLLF